MVVHCFTRVGLGDGGSPVQSLVGALIEGAERFVGADVFGVACGTHGRILDANDAFLDAIGVGRSDLAQVSVTGVFAVAANEFCGGGAREFEVCRGDGTIATVLSVGITLGCEGEWLAITVDLTGHKATDRAIAYLAMHDALTGLPNRRLLEDRLRHALTSAQRRDGAIAVLFLDVDHFKDINDSCGHRVGDEVLREVARRLHSVLRDSDTVARAGGDEFVVVLEDLRDPTESTRIAERARVAIRSPLEVEGRDIEVTVSIGVAWNVDASDTVETLLRRSDTAMYAAKRAGRDQVSFDAREVLHPSPKRS